MPLYISPNSLTSGRYYNSQITIDEQIWAQRLRNFINNNVLDSELFRPSILIYSILVPESTFYSTVQSLVTSIFSTGNTSQQATKWSNILFLGLVINARRINTFTNCSVLPTFESSQCASNSSKTILVLGEIFT